MRRVLLTGALCLVLGSSLSAATVISGCTLDSLAHTCYTSGTFSFADTLDWGAAVNLAPIGQSGFGPALNPGNPANPQNVSVMPWNARSVGNVNIFASLSAGPANTQVLTRVDNTFWGYGMHVTSTQPMLQWAPPDDFLTPSHLVTFAGHFANNPTSQDPNAFGEHLLGDISGNNGSLVLNFDHNVSQIGFRIASNSTSSNTNFTATINAYNGNTVLHTYSIVVTGGGGICDGLKPAFPNEGNAPVPCNDAAFIAIDAGGVQHITSIQVITSNVSNGFFISGLQFNSDEVPEPGITLLMASGLVGLWLFSTARQRFTGTR